MLPNTHFRPLKTKNLAIRAFAPANISLIFETYPAAPPHGRGSLGVGITLAEGVVASVQRATSKHPAGIYVGAARWEFPTVQEVIRALTTQELHIELAAAFPFGCGFGMSGASALASALAINELLQLGISYHELGMIAHNAEVASATGLGDVGGQYNGGIMMKTVKYQPLHVTQLPVQAARLYVQVFGPIHTADVIDSAQKLQSINTAGHAALAALVKLGHNLSIDALFNISHRFAKDSGLLTHQEMITKIETIHDLGGAATMIMLGEAIVSTVPFPDSEEVTVVHGGARLIAS